MTLSFGIALNSPVSSDLDPASYISRLSRDRGATRWCEPNRLKRCRLTDRRLTAPSVQFPLIRTSPEITSARRVLISDAAHPIFLGFRRDSQTPNHFSRIATKMRKEATYAQYVGESSSSTLKFLDDVLLAFRFANDPRLLVPLPRLSPLFVTPRRNAHLLDRDSPVRIPSANCPLLSHDARA